MSSSQPWNEFGIQHARALVSHCDELSRICEKCFAGHHGRPGIPRDFSDPKWRYEFYIFWMFWLWYVANSPKLLAAGATKPLLDAFCRGCREQFVRSRLIEDNLEAIRQWEDDLDERFRAYMKAWDKHLTEGPKEPRLIEKGGVGWLFARYLFSTDLVPNSAFVVFFDEFGSHMFTSTVEMLKQLEDC